MTGNADPEASRSYYGYVDAGDYESLFGLFAEDIVYDRPGQDPIEGMAEFKTFYRDGRPLEDSTHHVEQVLADGDTVCVRGRFEGRQGGEPVQFGFADFHRYNDEGLIDRRWTYTDRDEV